MHSCHAAGVGLRWNLSWLQLSSPARWSASHLSTQVLHHRFRRAHNLPCLAAAFSSRYRLLQSMGRWRGPKHNLLPGRLWANGCCSSCLRRTPALPSRAVLAGFPIPHPASQSALSKALGMPPDASWQRRSGRAVHLSASARRVFAACCLYCLAAKCSGNMV